jgi:sRNA-binding protein
VQQLQRTSNKQQATRKQQQATRNKQHATSNTQHTTRNQQQATSSKPQATSNKQHPLVRDAQVENTDMQIIVAWPQPSRWLAHDRVHLDLSQQQISGIKSARLFNWSY